MWVRLVKKFIIYAAGCAYTAYCLFNINGWVKYSLLHRRLKYARTLRPVTVGADIICPKRQKVIGCISTLFEHCRNKP